METTTKENTMELRHGKFGPVWVNTARDKHETTTQEASTMTVDEQRAASEQTSFVHPKSGITFPAVHVPCADCGKTINMHPDSYADTRGLIRCVHCGAERSRQNVA